MQNVPKRRRWSPTGAAILSLVSLARVVLQFAAIPVLARLLGPYPYGLMAVAMPVVSIAMQISDFGLSAMLIRERERAAEDTAFWIAAAVSILVTAALVLAAWVVGEQVDPEARPVILAMAAMPWLSLAMAVPLARLARDQRLGIIALGDIVGVLLGLAVAIYGAAAEWGVWCLVAQQVVLLAARAFTYLGATRYHPRLAFDRARFRRLIGGAANLTGSNLFATASRTFDNLLVGLLIGPRPAGAYAMTYQFARLPETVIGGPVSLSLTAKFARFDQEESSSEALQGRCDSSSFATTMRSLALVTTPTMVGLALLAEPVVDLLLGPQWEGADRVLASLCGAGLFLALGTVPVAVMTGVGAYRLRAVQSCVQFVAILAAVIIGARWNVVVVGWAVTGAYAAQFAWATTVVSRRLGASALTGLTALALPAVAAGAMGVAVMQARVMIGPGLTPIVAIVIFGTIGACGYLGTIMAVRRRAVLDDLRDIMMLLS